MGEYTRNNNIITCWFVTNHDLSYQPVNSTAIITVQCFVYCNRRKKKKINSNDGLYSIPILKFMLLKWNYVLQRHFCINYFQLKSLIECNKLVYTSTNIKYLWNRHTHTYTLSKMENYLIQKSRERKNWQRENYYEKHKNNNKTRKRFHG